MHFNQLSISPTTNYTLASTQLKVVHLDRKELLDTKNVVINSMSVVLR